jgi:hypothetical protein
MRRAFAESRTAMTEMCGDREEDLERAGTEREAIEITREFMW